MSPDPSTPRPHWTPTFLLLTCEHAGSQVPHIYAGLFAGAGDVLQTHRGLDIGALPVALRMASTLSAPIIFAMVTRLLVDPNRSLDNPALFSEFTRDLPEDVRTNIVAAHYTPHRAAVERIVADAVHAGRRVLHVGVHSCTDVLGGAARDLDIALLFDPARASEASLCAAWRRGLEHAAPTLRHRFNEPYLGTDDGLTTTLRTRFPAGSYAGVEIELRQGFVLTEAAQRFASDLLTRTLAPLLAPDQRGMFGSGTTASACVKRGSTTTAS